MTELERCVQIRDLALDCYLAAVKAMAQYAVELDDEITGTHRKYLSALADEVASAEPTALSESRATLRGLLRDYRDRASRYLNTLRDELAGTARALQEILDALSQTDNDHEAKVRTAVSRLRQIVAASGEDEMHAAVAAAADTIEASLEQIRKQHQLTVSQFVMEIRMLHKRIDALERAASIDSLTKLWNRPEMEERIHSPQPAGFSLILVRAAGFRLAEAHFNREVSEELAGAFCKRLRNCLPPSATIGRWSADQFIALLGLSQPEALGAARWISEHLGGTYSCLLNGKTVRPSLQLTVAVVDSAGDPPERILERVAEFFT